MILMIRVILLTLSLALISGCGPSYEAEYQAAQQELAATRQQLAEAQQKLNAADHETRNRIFLLARRSNNQLNAENPDSAIISKVQEEMQQLLSDSYATHNNPQDLSALTAKLYSDKLTLILDLRRQSRSAYDRQLDVCLSALDSPLKKNDLSIMLCEVQAEAAARKPSQLYTANLTALNRIGNQLLTARQSDSQFSQLQIDDLFGAAAEQQLKQLSN